MRSLISVTLLRCSSVLAVLALAACPSNPGSSSSGGKGGSSSAGGSATSGGSNGGGSTSGSGGGSGGLVTLNGAVAKGPFIVDSSVTVSPVDQFGNPSGTSFPTETSDSLGDFTVHFSYQGPVLLEATGDYYNEITGGVSGLTLTLDAYANIAQSGSQDAYINVLTQLTHDRVLALLSDGGVSVPAAVAQAEQEIEAALPIGGTGYDAGASATQMNLLTGDNNANAYLFATSATFAEAAQLNAGSNTADGELQLLINDTANSFGASGTIPSATVTELQAAAQVLEPDFVMASMQSYFQDGGSTLTVPNINRALDSDGDGFTNFNDTCVLQANPDQSVIPPGVCAYRHLSITTSGAQFQNGWLQGDVNGDGHDDLLYVGTDVQVWLANDGGVVGTPISSSFTAAFGFSSSGPSPTLYDLRLADVNGDGNADLLTSYASSSNSSTGSTTYAVAYLPGNGTGSFGAPVTLQSLTSSPNHGGGVNDGGVSPAFFPYALVDVLPINTGGVQALVGFPGASSTNGGPSGSGTTPPPGVVLATQLLLSDGGLGAQQYFTLTNVAADVCPNNCPASCTAQGSATLCPSGCPEGCVGQDAGSCPTGCSGACTPVDYDAGGYCPADCPINGGTCTPLAADAGYCPTGCAPACTVYSVADGYCADNCPVNSPTNCDPISPDAGSCPTVSSGTCPASCQVYAVDAGWCPSSSCAASCTIYSTDAGYCPQNCINEGLQTCPAGVACPGPSCTPPNCVCPADCPNGCLPDAGGCAADCPITCNQLPQNACPPGCTEPPATCPNGCGSSGPAGGSCPPGCACSTGCPESCNVPPSSCTNCGGGSQGSCPSSCACPAGCPTSCVPAGADYCGDDCSGPAGGGCTNGCLCPGCPSSCTSVPFDPQCQNCSKTGQSQSCPTDCPCLAGCPTSCTEPPNACQSACTGPQGNNPCQTGCTCPVDCPSPASCTPLPNNACPVVNGVECPAECVPQGAQTCQSGCGTGQQPPCQSGCLCPASCPADCTNSCPLGCGNDSQYGQCPTGCLCPTGCPTSCTPGGTPTPVNGIAFGNFNADNVPDVAISIGSEDQSGGASGLYVLLNDGTGNFTASAVPSVTGNVGGVITADFDGDGNLDLAVADLCGTTGNYVVYVVYGDGQGNFGNLVTVQLSSTVNGCAGGGGGIGGSSCTGPGAPTNLNAADVNGDGKADLFVNGMVLGSQGRSFGPPISLTQGNGNCSGGLNGGSQTVAHNPMPDFNLDGNADALLPMFNELFLINPPGYHSW